MESSGGTRLLLVEDEAVLALAEKRSLEARGYAVALAMDGEAAVAACAGGGPFDLVLMDINLGPGMDGTEAALAILGTRDIPILFLSSHTEPEIVSKTESISSYGYVVKNSGMTVLEASIKMALKLHEAHRIIAESGTRQNAMMGNITDVVAIFDVGNRLGYVSPNVTRLFGWEPAEILGTLPAERIHPEDLARVQAELRPLFAVDRAEKTLRYRFLAKGGAYRHVEATATNLRADPAIRGILVTYHDVTQRVETEPVIRERLSMTMQAARILWWEMDLVKGGFELDQRAIGMFGYAPGSFGSFGEFLPIVHPEDSRLLLASLGRLSSGASASEEIELRLMAFEGNYQWCRLFARAVDGQAGTAPASLAGFLLDIDARKAAELEVRRLLEGKELLLREVKHRVKNNMAIVQSLLALQADKVAEPGAEAALLDAAARIAAMAGIFDLLQTTPLGSAVSLASYLPPLVDGIAASIRGGDSVRIVKEIEDFSVDAKKAQLLGIAVNELITNAMKHAFAGRSGGEIRIVAKAFPTQALVSVIDDGRGLPEAGRGEGAEGMGLALVGAIACQLGGRVTIDGGLGMRVSLEFEK